MKAVSKILLAVPVWRRWSAAAPAAAQYPGHGYRLPAIGGLRQQRRRASGRSSNSILGGRSYGQNDRQAVEQLRPRDRSPPQQRASQRGGYGYNYGSYG